MNYKDKIITLSDGYQYVILEDTIYEGKTYALANEVEDGKLGENITLFRVDNPETNPTFVIETDLSIAEKVLNILAG